MSIFLAEKRLNEMQGFLNELSDIALKGFFCIVDDAKLDYKSIVLYYSKYQQKGNSPSYVCNISPEAVSEFLGIHVNCKFPYEVENKEKCDKRHCNDL